MQRWGCGCNILKFVSISFLHWPMSSAAFVICDFLLLISPCQDYWIIIHTQLLPETYLSAILWLTLNGAERLWLSLELYLALLFILDSFMLYTWILPELYTWFWYVLYLALICLIPGFGMFYTLLLHELYTWFLYVSYMALRCFIDLPLSNLFYTWLWYVFYLALTWALLTCFLITGVTGTSMTGINFQGRRSLPSLVSYPVSESGISLNSSQVPQECV